MALYASILLFLCASAATCSDSVAISAGALASTQPPAWYTAARAMERAEDAATRAMERAEDKATVGGLQQAVGGLQQAVGSLQQAVGSLQQAVGSLQETARSHASILKQVAEAVVTQAVAQQVDQCAPFTALFMEIGTGGGNFSHCSAVPMFSAAPRPAQAFAPAPLNPSPFFLTSAHCFSMHIPREPVRLAFQDQFYSCGKQHFFNSSTTQPLDLALVRCTGVPVPPTTISTQPYLIHQPAALLGYSFGEQVANRMYFSEGAKRSVLHIRFTRLALTMQLPDAPENTTRASLERGAGSRAGLLLQSDTGYVDTSPEQGMSGGAVVDLQCGLWGITKSKSLWRVGGSFVLLNPAAVAMVETEAALL